MPSLRAELERTVLADVRFDPGYRAAYSCDSSRQVPHLAELVQLVLEQAA